MQTHAFAGCCLTLLLICGLPAISYAAMPQQTCTMHVAITVDDLPFVRENLTIQEMRKETGELLAALKAYRVPAIGFVNEDKLLVNGQVDARIGLLRDWLDAGMTLGNHSYGHVGLQTTPLSDAEAAVLKGEVITRWLMNEYDQTPRYYRYPYNQTGPTKEIREAFLAFLHQHGYAIAPFTIEDDDYVYALVYDDDLLHGNMNEAQKIRNAYIAHLIVSFSTFETMSQELFGRQINQILVLHANRLNADSLDTQLMMLEKRGYCFVSLDAALKDPAYTSPDGYVGPYGMSWLHRWSIGLHKKLSVYGQPDPEDWIMRRYEMIHQTWKVE